MPECTDCLHDIVVVCPRHVSQEDVVVTPHRCHSCGGLFVRASARGNASKKLKRLYGDYRVCVPETCLLLQQTKTYHGGYSCGGILRRKNCHW